MIKNIGSNWGLTALGVVVTYILLPYNVRHLGPDGYGTWILIASLTGYLGLLALGAPMASVRYIAEFAAQKKIREQNVAIGTFAGLYLSMGLASLVIGAGVYWAFVNLYHVPPEILPQAKIAFALVVLNVSAGFVQQLPYGIMAAHHDFVLRNLIAGSGQLLRLAFNLVLLAFWPTVAAVAVVQLTVLCFEFTVSGIMIRRRYPEIEFSLDNFDGAMLKRIFGFSLYVLVLSIGIQLSFQTDSLVIGGFMDVGHIAYFTVASSLPLYLMQFVIAIGAVVMPTATKCLATGDMATLREVCLKWSKIAYSLTLMVGIYLLVLGPRFLGWWVGPSFEAPAGSVLRILMLSYLVYLPVRGVAQAILMGIEKQKRPTIAFLATGLVNLVLSIALVGPLGLDGVAWGTAIPNVIFAVLILVWNCHELGLSVAEFMRYVFLKPTIGAILPLLTAWAFLHYGDVRGFGGLFLSGVVTVAVFGLVWLFYVYRGDKYLDLVVRLKERFA